MADNSNAAASVLVAFAVGAAVGAAVALLYAPATGEETRRKLAQKAREGRDKAESLAREGREFLDRQRESIATVMERGRDAYESVPRASAGTANESCAHEPPSGRSCSGNERSSA